MRMCAWVLLCLPTLHGISGRKHAESRYDELKNRIRPVFIALLTSTHRAAGCLADAVILGKHHAQIEFDHVIQHAADDQEALAGLGVLGEDGIARATRYSRSIATPAIPLPCCELPVFRRNNTALLRTPVE
jgi:hypothetical protein